MPPRPPANLTCFFFTWGKRISLRGISRYDHERPKNTAVRVSKNGEIVGRGVPGLNGHWFSAFTICIE